MPPGTEERPQRTDRSPTRSPTRREAFKRPAHIECPMPADYAVSCCQTYAERRTGALSLPSSHHRRLRPGLGGQRGSADLCSSRAKGSADG